MPKPARRHNSTTRRTCESPLRRARRCARVAAQEAADIAAVDERTLRRYESGELRLPDETRIALARRYGDRSLLESHPVVQAWIAWGGESLDRDVCDRFPPLGSEMFLGERHNTPVPEPVDWPRVRAEMVEMEFVGGELRPKPIRTTQKTARG